MKVDNLFTKKYSQFGQDEKKNDLESVSAGVPVPAEYGTVPTLNSGGRLAGFLAGLRREHGSDGG